MLPSRLTFIKSVSMSVAVSKMGVVLCQPGVKVCVQYCLDILLCQQILDSIKRVIDDNFVVL